MQQPPVYRKLLRKLRKQRRLSARQLAKQVDLHPSYISKIETGAVPPPAWDKMVTIATALESPELLEAGEFALLKHALILTGNLMVTLAEMPRNIEDEIGRDTLLKWQDTCREMWARMRVAFKRRGRWENVVTSGLVTPSRRKKISS